MTDNEIKDLARKVSIALYPRNTVEEKDEKVRQFLLRQTSEIMENVIKEILRDHCIVSREKVTEEIKAANNVLNQPSQPKLKYTLGYVHGVMYNLFPDLFQKGGKE